jgi:hypothetical protein
LIFIKAAIPVRLLASPTGGVGREHVALREASIALATVVATPIGRSQKDRAKAPPAIAKQMPSFGSDRSWKKADTARSRE